MTKRGGLGPASEPTPVDCEVVSLCAPNPTQLLEVTNACPAGVRRREYLRDSGCPAIYAAAAAAVSARPFTI